MLVYVDESGSPGLKAGAGATEFFTVAFVVFEDQAEAARVDRRIELLRQELRLPPSFEFHFTNAKKKNRKAFFQAVAPFEFFYFAATINKVGLPSNELHNAKAFYRYVCGLAFESVKPYLQSATVAIDYTGGRVFRDQLSTYLRRRASLECGRESIKKIQFVDSAASSLIQMADMVAGAIHRSYTNREDPLHYRKLISHREMDVTLWPR